MKLKYHFQESLQKIKTQGNKLINTPYHPESKT